MKARAFVAVVAGFGCTEPPPPAVNSVTLGSPAAELAVGESVALVLTVGGTGVPLSVEWTVSNNNALAVNAAGVVTGKQTATGVTVCAVSTYDPTKKGCVVLDVFRERSVTYWLRIPATAALPTGPRRVQYGETISFKDYGQGFFATIDTLRYSDGSLVPSDLPTVFCLFLGNACAVTASGLAANYYSPDIKNSTSVQLTVAIRRPTPTGTAAYTCMATVDAGTTSGLPYYESFFGNPNAGEVRVFAGPGCVGKSYDVPVSGINYSANPSGFVVVNLTTVP